MIVIWFAESFERKLRPLCSISSLQCNRRATQRWTLSSLHHHHHHHFDWLADWSIKIWLLQLLFWLKYTKIFQQFSRPYGLTYSDWFTLVALISTESKTFTAVLSSIWVAPILRIFSLIHPGRPISNISKTFPAVLSPVRISLWPPINCLLVQRLPRLPQVIKIAEKADIAKSKIWKI